MPAISATRLSWVSPQEPRICGLRSAVTSAAVSRRRVSPVCCTWLTCTRSSADIAARSFSTSVSRAPNRSRLSRTGTISCSVALSRTSAWASAALPCRSRVSVDSTLNWLSIASRSAAISWARATAASRWARASASSAATVAASACAAAASDRTSATSARTRAASSRAKAASVRDCAISAWALASSVRVGARCAPVCATSASRRARATSQPARAPSSSPSTSPAASAITVMTSTPLMVPASADNPWDATPGSAWCRGRRFRTYTSETRTVPPKFREHSDRFGRIRSKPPTPQPHQ